MISVCWRYSVSIGASVRTDTRQRTIQQLIDEHKVVLDGLLVKLAKVPLSQLDQPVEELKDQRGIGVALGDGHQVDVFVLDMAKGRASERQDGRPDLGVGDDLDAEDVGEARPAVVAKGAEDEVFALLVEDEHAGEHLCGETRRKKKGKGKEKRREAGSLARAGGCWCFVETRLRLRLRFG